MVGKKLKVVELDGRTGEGGGQLVRIAIALSALTGIPIKIHHVRGNRGGGRGGGLKAQHASAVRWLAEATHAETKGVFVGSKEFEFAPCVPPPPILNRNIRIKAESAASTLLVLQAIFPRLLYASDDDNSPVTLTIEGGTNVPYSLSFDYLDQVLLPTLERLGLPKVERKIEFSRGWSHGNIQLGCTKFKFFPLKPGETLNAESWPEFRDPGTIQKIDVTMVVPKSLREDLKRALIVELGIVFPGIETAFIIDEDSRHQARIYALLVAKTSNGFRFGRDWLYDKTVKNKSNDKIATEVSQTIVDGLDAEIRKGGCVDEHLQDQLAIFQALAVGRSVVAGASEKHDMLSKSPSKSDFRSDEMGSMHAKTARWVISEMLPGVKWTDQGRVCEGIGWKSPSSSAVEESLASLSIEDK